MKRTSRRPRRNPSPLDNPAFRRWFGDSKVVDERGEPLVVYHASRPDTEAFDVFDIERSLDIGFHFGTFDAAESFGGAPRPFYLKIKRPLRLIDPGGWIDIDLRTSTIDQLLELKILDRDTYERIRSLILKRMSAVRAIGNRGEGYWRYSREDVAVEWRRLRLDAGRLISSAIQRAGYDGVVYRNTVEGGESYMVFDPRQIKSATDNVGTFDPSDPSILRNRRSSRRTSKRTSRRSR